MKKAIWKIKRGDRQAGLDYIEKLKQEGEKVIEIIEEKDQFIIIMEDNV